MNDFLVAEYSAALIKLFPVCQASYFTHIYLQIELITSAEILSLSPIPNALQTTSFG